MHNLRAGVHYPPLLLTAGAHDDIVTPASSYKVAAVLQSMQSAVSTLLRVDYDTGFGPGTPTAKQIALDTDRLVFLVNAVHVTR